MKRILTLCHLAMAILAAGVFVACSDEDAEQLMDGIQATRASKSAYVGIGTPKVNGRSAVLDGYVEGMELSEVKKVGFAYSTENVMPDARSGTGCFRIASRITAEGSFSASLPTMKEDATYYIRAYMVTTSIDTIYSEVTTCMATVLNPSLTTMPVVNRARLGAVVFARFDVAGTRKLKSWGVCLSEKPMPTVDDTKVTARDTCKLDGFKGEFGVFFEQLEADRLYFVRAYTLTEDGNVYYGDSRMFRTTRGGNYSWRWASNAEGAKKDNAYDRITEAMDSASYYYNNYSNLYLSASVEYNTGVQTADCSFGGWIRFGSNSRYQWVGTAQHETSHGLGVGTSWNWGNLCVSGLWTKPIANRTLRAVMNDQTLTIKGDTQHFWPGGINQREEVTSGTANSYGQVVKNERMLRANAMILNAMSLDGLVGPQP